MSRTTNFSKKRKGNLLVISLIDASIRNVYTNIPFFVYLFFSNSNKKAYSFAVSFKASKRPEAPP